MRNKEIKNHVFLECLQHTDNKFWQSLFEELAYGVTPHGTYFCGDLFCCKFKNKSFTYNYTEKDSLTLFNEISELLKNKLNIFSEIERKNIKLNVKNSLENQLNKSWSSIKKKNLKELLIKIFISNMKNKHNLSEQQAKDAYLYINLAIIFKTITPDDIVYDGENVVSIKGMEFKEGEVIFNKDIESIIDTEIDEYDFVVDKTNVSDDWDKFIKDVAKNKI